MDVDEQLCHSGEVRVEEQPVRDARACASDVIAASGELSSPGVR